MNTRCLLLLILPLWVRAAWAADSTPALRPDKAAYLRLAGEMETNLQKEILNRWFPAAVDEQSGGFFENFSLDWVRQPGRNKSIVFQSRLTWTAAQAAKRFPERADFYLAMTRRGVACLTTNLWDKERGGFYWSTDGAGHPNENLKHIYGVSFGLYALAGSYPITKDQANLDLAKECFRWLEAHAHDSQNKGYYESIALDGTPDTGGNNPIGAKAGQKSMNTHIHLLESLTELYRVWPDPAVRARVQEVFELCRDKIYSEPGLLTQYLTADWRRVPGPDSFGHDVEAGFLMVEAAEALGRLDDARAWTAARRLVDHALEYGWDAQRGGLYDAAAVDARGVVTGGLRTEKIWWVEAEQLNALLLLHERFGHQTDNYWEAFLKQWNFISQYQVDHERGGWYPTVQADGRAASKVKSDSWTECYHQGRAMLVVSEQLRSLARDGVKN